MQFLDAIKYKFFAYFISNKDRRCVRKYKTSFSMKLSVFDLLALCRLCGLQQYCIINPYNIFRCRLGVELMAPQKVTVLVTGFQPFGEYKINSSWIAVSVCM